MDNAARPRRNISTDDLLKIVSRIHTCTYGENPIRYLDASGDRWIVFADVCRALGYKNPNHESKKVDSAEKCKLDIGLKNTLAVCINQRGLLRFTLFANKAEVAGFQAWATTEIFGDNLQPNQIGGDYHGHSTADTLSHGHA